jgi:hypothetical protein
VTSTSVMEKFLPGFLRQTMNIMRHQRTRLLLV